MRGEVAIGVPGAIGEVGARALAPRVEAAGFAALWLNDSPQGDSLAGLTAAAEVTAHLRLATGVLPVDRLPAAAILAAIARTGVPEARLTLGIGSGQIREQPVERVRDALRELRDGTSAALVVGALGPRMRALAAEEADGALLSWLTPSTAQEHAAAVRGTGRTPAPRAAIYVRTIVDEAARPALEREAEQYAAYPAYRRNFARLGVDPIDTTLPQPGRDLGTGLEAYREGVEEVVLRAITPDGTLDQLLAFVDRAAGLLR